MRLIFKRIKSASRAVSTTSKSTLLSICRIIFACLEIVLLSPQLYREYHRVRPRGLKNKFLTICRIVYLAYIHKIQPYVGKLPRVKISAPQFAILTVAVVVLAASILPPAMQAQAASLLWTNNVDFALNQMANGRGNAEHFTVFAYPFWLVLVTLLAMAAVGFLVAYLPARRASRINSIDALRRE